MIHYLLSLLLSRKEIETIRQMKEAAEQELQLGRQVPWLTHQKQGLLSYFSYSRGYIFAIFLWSLDEWAVLVLYNFETTLPCPRLWWYSPAVSTSNWFALFRVISSSFNKRSTNVSHSCIAFQKQEAFDGFVDFSPEYHCYHCIHLALSKSNL